MLEVSWAVLVFSLTSACFLQKTMFAVPIYRVRNLGQLVQGSRFAWVLFAAIGLSQLIPSGVIASRTQSRQALAQQADAIVHASIDHLASNGIKPSQSDIVIHDLIGNDGRWQFDSAQLQRVLRGPDTKCVRWISRHVGALLQAPCDLVGLAVRLQI